MADLSVFKCISCYKEYDIQEIRYRCECGNLLEVLHDLGTAIPNPQSWKESLDVNMAEIAFSRYKSLLFPLLPDTALITLSEGDTPLYDVTKNFGSSIFQENVKNARENYASVTFCKKKTQVSSLCLL